MMDPRWRRHWLLNRVTLGLWLGWLPVGAFALGHRDLNSLPWVYMTMLMIVAAISALLACPNCSEPFSLGFRQRTREISAPWAPRCVNCRIKLGDTIPDARTELPEAKRSSAEGPPTE